MQQASIVTQSSAPQTAALTAQEGCPVAGVEQPCLVKAGGRRKISIVTPSYNQARYLEECIDSVLSQNYPDLEYIIMDGGSTDGSLEIIKKYQKYLAYWQSCPDGGQHQAINDGFRRSNGEIMAWLNSDDKYHPGAFCLVADAFDAFPDLDWLMGSPTLWDADGRVMGFEGKPPVWSRAKYLRGEFHSPYIQQESSFWSRSLWRKAGGGLDTAFELAADLDLWARFFRYAQLYTLHAPIGGFRSHPGQKSSDFRNQYHQEAERIVLREQELSQNSGEAMLPPPQPLWVKDVVSRANSSIAAKNFEFFTYSRAIHFPYFGSFGTDLHGKMA